MFHDVYNLLSQTCAQFLQGSNFLSDALHLVRSLLTPASGPVTFQSVNTHEYPHVLFNKVSPYVDPVANAACTTPPPDEPSAMEITASQSVIIETNDTAMKPLVRGWFIFVKFSGLVVLFHDISIVYQCICCPIQR